MSEQIQIINQDQIQILKDEASYILIYKPAGIESSDELILALISLVKSDDATPEFHLVHRLDKFTSGVMLIAKNLKAKAEFERQFKERIPEKIYYAIVEGAVKDKKGQIDKRIAVDPENSNRRIVAKFGKEAVTDYELSQRLRGHSLLKLMPQTGRTHQLRVHLSYIGHAILGDRMYAKSSGNRSKTEGFYLIAKKLSFENPRTHKKITIEIGFPKFFKEKITNLHY